MKTFTLRRRGSLLIVAMLFSGMIAIGLTSYLTMARNALNLANRSFLENQAMNLTESGLELAINALNNSAWSSPWTITGNNATATFTGFTYGQNASGSVKIYIQNYNSNGNAVVVSEGIITPASGPQLTKEVEITGIVQRSLFAKGLVGRNGLSFSGNNASIDSWNSLYNSDGTPRASAVPYSAAVADDAGSVAALNVTANISVSNADIWGTASVGSSSDSSISVGPQGRVGPYGTASGTLDPNSISTNFTDNLQAVTAPTPSAYNSYTSSQINGSPILPQAADVAASDGKYYYKFTSLTGGNVTISAGKNVVFLPQASVGADAIKLNGNSDGITVNSGGTLNIYTAANITIAGNGIVNNNATSVTSAVGIWGVGTVTNPPSSTQTISISGNGSLGCTCYAPNATLNVKGGGHAGSIYGAFVAYSVNMTGNDAFHYDEALGLTPNTSVYSPSKWRELVSSTDRTTYSSQLNF